MHIRPIRTEADHEAALRAIEGLWGAEPGTEAGDDLEVLAALVEAYEAEHHPVQALDPVDAIKAHMDLAGYQQSDLAELFGSRSRASEVLSRRRPLTLHQIQLLVTRWQIPAHVLVTPQAAGLEVA